MGLYDSYEHEGFFGPVKAFEEEEMRQIAPAVLHEFEQSKDAFSARRNRHLDWDVAKHLAFAPAIVQAATQLLGPEPRLWRTQFFAMEGGQGLRWHQDEYKALLADPLRHLSIHLAITHATPDNCLIVAPGTHRMDRSQLAELGFNHIEGSDQNAYGAPNFWRTPTETTPLRKMILKPGEFFVFHPMLLHASFDLTTPPNAFVATRTPGSARRIGLGIRVAARENAVYPAAFGETASRGDHAVAFVIPGDSSPT